MTRSSFKGPYIEGETRRSTIFPKHVGKTVRIYNGKVLKKIQLTQDMIGHLFGEFSYTRKLSAVPKRFGKS